MLILIIVSHSASHSSTTRKLRLIASWAELTSLQKHGIEDGYIELLKNIYINSSTTVHLLKESNKTNISRGVQQGVILSSNLFTAAPESIFRRVTWEIVGLKIDSEYLSHLRFADDKLIFDNTPDELSDIVQDLVDESANQGLNKSTTQVMKETDTPIYDNNTLIKNVESYIYFGYRYSTSDKNQDKEFQKRFTALWTSLAKNRDIFKGNISKRLKRQFCNSWNGKGYIKQHISGQKNKRIGKRKYNGRINA